MTREMVSVTLLGLALWGCGDSATMRPGEDCLSCHASGDHAFTLAGTVFGDAAAAASAGLGDVTITITDKNGAKVTMTSNSAGNFYTSQALAFPVAVAVRRGSAVSEMSSASSGACNDCHKGSGSPGRVYVP